MTGSIHHKAFHLQRLGFENNPFPLSPNGSNYFLSAAMQVHLSEIIHCIEMRKGFMLVTGDVGLGKSTLSRRLMREMSSSEICTALVLNTFLQGASLIAEINRDFGTDVSGPVNNSIENQLAALNTFLLAKYRAGMNCLIIIDDAQHLNVESLELIRQLSNLESESEKLVQILLIAQPEILDKLAESSIRQLRSRIALHVSLDPLSETEGHRYIQFLLARAGGQGQLELNRSAIQQIFKQSRGYPRRINMIMDRCLYAVAAHDLTRIDGRLIKQAATEIEIGKGHSQQKSWRLPSLAAGVALAVLLLLAIPEGWWSSQSNVLKHQLSAVDHTPSANTAALAPAVDAADTVENAAVPQSTSVKAPAEDPHPAEAATDPPEARPTAHLEYSIASIRDFLEPYGLVPLADDFMEAVTTLSFDELKGKLLVHGRHGLVVRTGSGQEMSARPDAYPFTTTDGETRWLILRKPQILAEKFEIGEISNDVLRIQRALKELGFYRSRIDGQVGSKTVAAIAGFQYSIGLLTTGKPSVDTLLALEEMSSEFNHTTTNAEAPPDMIDNIQSKPVELRLLVQTGDNDGK